MSEVVDYRQVRATGMIRILRHGDPGVLALAAVLLLAGWGLRHHYADRMVQYKGLGLTLEYPESWGGPQVVSDKDGQAKGMVMLDVLCDGAVKPAIRVSTETVPGEVKPGDIASYLLLARQQEATLFHLISQKQEDRGPAGKLHWMIFAHAINPADSAEDPAATDTPAVVRVSSLVVHRGSKLLRVDVEQTVAQHKADPGLARRVLQTVKAH